VAGVLTFLGEDLILDKKKTETGKWKFPPIILLHGISRIEKI